MDVQSCRIFLSLIRTGSFSATAQLFYMSQPTVSQRVRQLEDELGVALVVRAPHHLALTEAGKAFLPHAEALIDTWDRGREDLSAFTTQVEGPVHVWASQTAGGYILPQALCAFADRYPTVSVRLQIGNSAQVEQAVLEGHADFGVIESPSVSGQLLAQDWIEDELACVVRADHPLTSKDGAISPTEANRWLFALREPGSGTRETLLAAWPGVDGPNRILEMGSLAAIRESLLTGRVVSFVSRWVVAQDLEQKRLAECHIHGIRAVRRMRLVRRRSPFPSRASALLFDAVLASPKEFPRSSAP